jgi:hypothetical protein
MMKSYLKAILYSFLLILCACTRTDANEKLQYAKNALQEALDGGKMIASVKSIEQGTGGWYIIFSDKSTLSIMNDDSGSENDIVIKEIIVEDGYVSLILQDGTTFIFQKYDVMPQLISMEFYSATNAQRIKEDVTCTIQGDSIICYINELMDDKLLIPHFVYEGDEVFVGEKPLTSDVTACDFSKPVKLTVRAEERVKEYTVYVYAYTGLPVLWIDTENGAKIVSKDDYLNAHFKLVDTDANVTELEGQIKGRGNSTWNAPKKPYRLKFSEKVGFLGEPKDKSWVLLANYYDKTLLRNTTAFYMGKISNLEYTPHFNYVEVIQNGQYYGTYQLGDNLKISKNRVNVGDDGFLLEIDAKAASDEITFRTSHISQPINIKDPDVEIGDDNYNYVKDYINAADAVLFSDEFTDPNKGWQKYLDMNSFVDWFLINEIAKNNDACFYSSCYMNLKRGGKLKMGPLWDFDIGFGNINYNGCDATDGFWIKNVAWYTRLFQDPVFVARVKERFDYFYNHQSDIFNYIDQQVVYLKYSIKENDSRWNIINSKIWPRENVIGDYQDEIDFMKDWLKERFEWLKEAFEGL